MTFCLDAGTDASHSDGSAVDLSPTNAERAKPTLRDFLAAVLPPQGHYCVFLAKSKAHHWASTIGGLASLVEMYADRTDSYFGTAAFKTRTSRKADNVAALRAFRLDLDAGASKLATQGPDMVYSSRQEAAEDLKRFTRAAGLRPSIVVSSGEGLHVYYVLEEPLTVEDWKPRAEHLQVLCESHGLKVDRSVTADAARILRAPGTMHKNGREVRIIHWEDRAQ